MLGIRPEAIAGPHGLDRSSPQLVIVEAPVEVIEPAGADTFVVPAIAGHEVIARFRASEDLRLCSFTQFAFDLTDAVLFDPRTSKRL